MPVTREEWAATYAMQARSDFEVYKILTQLEEVEACHRLHYLQMACEKIAKAYRLRDTETSLENAQTRHVAFADFIEIYLRSRKVVKRYAARGEMLKNVTRDARLFARDIERLAPAVDREQTPQNVEYPWEDNGEVICPCRYDFPMLRRLRSPAGANFLKVIETAFSDFDEIRL